MGKRRGAAIYDPDFLIRFMSAWQAAEHLQDVADAMNMSYYAAANVATKLRNNMGIELKTLSKKRDRSRLIMTVATVFL